VDNTGDVLSAINTSTDTVAGTVGLGMEPTDVTVAPDGTAIYVTNSASGNASVFHPPAITSPSSATFPIGQAGTFTVIATGAPTPTLPVPSGLPAWLSLTDNGDGTATLSGTPPPASAGAYQIALKATNALNTATQAFTLTVPPVSTVCANPPPPGPGSVVVSQSGATYTATNPAGETIYVTGNSVHVIGGPGPDKIFGGPGNDWLVGGGGDDLICGGDGNDQLVGGEGNDGLSGDAGNDRLTGGAGDDALEGGLGNDSLDGGTGTNTNVDNQGFNLCLNPNPCAGP
jgi:Ca2+-binding RTX toxin-like protein